MASDSPKRTYSEAMDIASAIDDHAGALKRYQSPSAAQIPQSGCDSPRSMVTERMQSLELRHDIDMEESGSPSPRKRPRIRDSVLGTERESGFVQTIEGGRRSISPSPNQRQHMTDYENSNTRRTRYRSPPPLIELSSSSSGTSSSTDSSMSALTWKPAEITGAEIDVLAGDDGEGIGGIAFRPTPQVAFARRQRRKQQVSDWRMREAREARQKRFEKRQGCRLHDGGTLRARSVRFAESQ